MLKEWTSDNGPRDVEVPSGNTALIRRKTLSAFMKAGYVPNSLLEVVRDMMMGKDVTMGGTVEDPWTAQQVSDLFVLVDTVVMNCVVRPEVWPVPVCPECKGEPDAMKFCSVCRGLGEGPREDDRLYIDVVDDEDKMFIFQYITMGVTDLKPFRGEPDGDVEAIQPSKVVRKASKRTVPDRG